MLPALLLPLTLAADPPPAPLPTVADPPAGEVASQLDRGHLARLGVWAGASAVGGGLAIGLGRDDPRAFGYGLQTVGWAAVNGAIVGLAWKGAGRTKTDAEVARTREVYALNIGLDVGYVGAGLAVALASRRAGWEAAEGHGWAAVTQGAGLLVLDAVVLGRYPRVP